VFEAFLEDLMWTPTTRAQHSCAGLRYGSDLTDGEWTILEPFLPPPRLRGRKRKWTMRQIVNAIFYRLRAGCAWEMLPDCFPPPSTVYRWFARFRDDGTWETINHHLLMRDRERVGRDASPTAAIMDSQSVKTTGTGGPRGYDAGKKVLGRKRQALVDTDGRAHKLHAPMLSPPAYRIATAPGRCSRRRGLDSLSSSGCSPIAATPDRALQRHPASPSRSCANKPTKSALPSSFEGGWSSGSSHG